MPVSHEVELKCPRCDHHEPVAVTFTLFPANYVTSGGTAIEAQVEFNDRADVERRFEAHYDIAGHRLTTSPNIGQGRA